MTKTYTITELAEKLSVHPDTLRKWEAAGRLTPIKTLGGHRRYVQSDVEYMLHQMRFPMTYNLFSETTNAWSRQDKFIWWKRFVDFHHHNSENSKDIKELYKREGTEMVLELLDSLTDEDWKSIDKIDEALEPVYSWYKKHHEYFWESKLYAMELSCKSTRKLFRYVDGMPIDLSKAETAAHYENNEKRFREMLNRLALTPATDLELDIIGYKLDGIDNVLWGWLHGIGDGNCDDTRKNMLKGKGIFPNARLQMELDKKNGWDGVSDFTEQREKLRQERALQRYSEENANPTRL